MMTAELLELIPLVLRRHEIACLDLTGGGSGITSWFSEAGNRSAVGWGGGYRPLQSHDPE